MGWFEVTVNVPNAGEGTVLNVPPIEVAVKNGEPVTVQLTDEQVEYLTTNENITVAPGKAPKEEEAEVVAETKAPAKKGGEK